MEIWRSPMENLAVNQTFWKGKRVLLTGHTGFKGSWMALWLQSMGSHVVGYAFEPPTNPNLFNAAAIGKGMLNIKGDIRNLEHLSIVFAENRPEIVVHMAAQSLVRYSYIKPAETYSTNVMGTLNLLEAVRATDSVKAVVIVTSDKCYDNREWVWGYRENDPMGGYDPYSSSKGCAELLTAAYRNSYFNPEDYAKHRIALATVRAGNVIGGGDWADDRLIPDIMRAMEFGQQVKIRNPHAIRPWQHVLEPLSGYLILAQKLYEEGDTYSESWNFGPNDEDVKPVLWIVEKLINLWGKDASWVMDSNENPHEAYYLKLDCSKARAHLNWHPRWHLDDALRAITDWHNAYIAGEDMREFTLNQIRAYCAHS